MSPTGLLAVDYRPEGERRRGREAWVAPWRADTLRDDFEDVLGDLAHYACELHPATSPSNPQQEVTMPLPTAAAEQRVSAPLVLCRATKAERPMSDASTSQALIIGRQDEAQSATSPQGTTTYWARRP